MSQTSQGRPNDSCNIESVTTEEFDKCPGEHVRIGWEEIVMNSLSEFRHITVRSCDGKKQALTSYTGSTTTMKD